MIKNGYVLSLGDNNEYVVVDNFVLNNITYIYLVDINNNDNIMYAKLELDEIVELTDPDELEKVVKIVNDNILKTLKNED